MKSIEEIQNKLDEMIKKKSRLESDYKILEDTDDEDMIYHLEDIDKEIYVLDKNIRLLSWVLN